MNLLTLILIFTAIKTFLYYRQCLKKTYALKMKSEYIFPIFN